MSTPPPDEPVLRDLARVLDDVDPPPPDLVELGRALFDLRALDDELAELAADSATDALATRDVVAAERMLSFVAGAISIDVQLTARAGGVELLGEIDPAPRGGRVEVLQLGVDEPLETEPDAGGRFTAVLPASGAARIRVLRPGGPAVSSPWFALA